jgi:hypothetical protein
MVDMIRLRGVHATRFLRRYHGGRMTSITLLGPQFREPNLGAVLGALGLHGPFAGISAGWQEREGELDELRSHVRADVTDLRIYERTEDVFSADRPLRLAHRARQAELQELQDLYTLRLRHAKDAARELFDRDGDSPTLRQARRQAIGALRRLDRAHLHSVRAAHSRFERTVRPAERPAVTEARAAVHAGLEGARAVLIAGGHVAVLLNRLRLLGAADWLAGRTLVAWSAGAMALAEAVVLFHDHPPQGAADAEVLDAGLALLRGVVPLPHAQTRLRLHDARRVALFARRFAPAVCLTLDHGSFAQFDDSRLRSHAGCFRFAREGALAEPALPADASAPDTRGAGRA